LYRNLSGEQGQPFYSVNGGKAMLLQAYPDALPEAVTEYIRSQKLVIAHDAATHGFVLPGYPTTPELQELVKQQTELRQQQVGWLVEEDGCAWCLVHSLGVMLTWCLSAVQVDDAHACKHGGRSSEGPTSRSLNSLRC
jgi:hypothetical protein